MDAHILWESLDMNVPGGQQYLPLVGDYVISVLSLIPLCMFQVFYNRYVLLLQPEHKSHIKCSVFCIIIVVVVI